MNVIFQRITSYTGNFQNFTRVVTILVKFDIQFTWTSMRNFLWCHIAMTLKVQHYSSKLLDRMFTPHDS